MTNRNPFDILGDSSQPGRVHGISEGKIERQVKRTWIGLVGGEEKERLRGALFNFHFRDRWTHSLDVASEGALQQILPRSIQALAARNFGAFDKGVPCHLVNLLAPYAACVRHQNGDVIAGMSHAVVQQEFFGTGLYIVTHAGR